MTRTAAIDCGTNSIKILVLDDGVPVLRDSRVVRLGQGVDTSGRLADEALARTFAAIDEFSGMLDDLAVDRLRFCATSATRDASNSAVFAAGVEARLGVTPEVLSGAEEAALVFEGAVGGLATSLPTPVLAVDIGGGSTELVLGDEAPTASVSLDVGSVRLHERHLRSDPPTAAEVAACAADADGALDGSGVDLAAAATVIGTSGTIKTLAAAMLDLPSYDRDAIDGAVLAVDETRAYVDRLLAMTIAERRAIPSMHPGRADVIGAGSLIWSRILARTTVESYVVSEADLLHAIARTA